MCGTEGVGVQTSVGVESGVIGVDEEATGLDATVEEAGVAADPGTDSAVDEARSWKPGIIAAIPAMQVMITSTRETVGPAPPAPS
jgi:hypothetical protein